jgi:hypothetical protein
MKQSINLGRKNQSGEKQSIKLLEQEINKPLKENGAASQGRKSSPHKKPKKIFECNTCLTRGTG